MSSEIEDVLDFAAIIWLAALLVLSLIGVWLLAAKGRDENVIHPRKEVLQWLSHWASLASTAAALLAVTVYTFASWRENTGLVVSIVYFIVIGLALAFLPTIAAWFKKREH